MTDRPDWVSGLVSGVHREIERFASARGLKKAIVEVQLRDGSRFRLESILPAPGHGFLTLVVHAGQGEPEEMIVPANVIARIELNDADEPEPAFGFSALRESAS